MLENFAVPEDERYFEDYVAGHVYEFRMIEVSAMEIIEFASKYDPQYFHIDAEKAKQAGLAASSPRDGTP
jgi:acyl dehydratase